jgi:hypothetical protein
LIEDQTNEKREPTFEDYVTQYLRIAQLARKETYQKHQPETEMLFEFVDNWPDFIKFFKENNLEIGNSLSGIILLNSWRLTNWITIDILSGKYFEAIRNLRFVFEGSVYAVLVEDIIETAVFEKWKKISTLDLKAEIFELWEECRRKWVCHKGIVDTEKVNRIVRGYVTARIDASKKDRMEEYIGIYSEILSDARLYLSTARMLQPCAGSLKLDDSDVVQLRMLWRELSRYQHFSYPYLKAVVDDPELVLVEELNDDLLKQSLSFYFGTLDFFYAVLAWRFQYLRKQIKEMCDWWSTNFHRTFDKTGKALASLPRPDTQKSDD